jgi:uncharacterized protein YeaO (DUF488 family)
MVSITSASFRDDTPMTTRAGRSTIEIGTIEVSHSTMARHQGPVTAGHRPTMREVSCRSSATAGRSWTERLGSGKPSASSPVMSRSTWCCAARCDLLTVASVRFTCRPATNGESPAVTRHPAWGRSSWHAPVETRQAYQGRRAVRQEPDVRLRRIYDDPEGDDGIRVLCGSTMAQGTEQGAGRARRLVHPGCPIGRAAQVDGHDPEKFEEFGSRCRTEIHEPERASALRREVFSCTAHSRA